MDIFLDRNQRNNSKTFYYLRLISEHRVGLVVHNGNYKDELRRQYMDLNRGFEEIPIYNIQNPKDIYLIRSRFQRCSLEGLVCDNEIVQDILNKNWTINDCLGNLKWLSDDEIREIILSDMALGKYMYEE